MPNRYLRRGTAKPTDRAVERGFMFTGAYRPVFLRQWREFRRLSLEAMSKQIGDLPTVVGTTTKATLSRQENGKLPYTRDTLEVYAEILGCDIIDLLTRPPNDPEGLWTIINGLRNQDARRVTGLLQALIAELGKAA